mgnify:CR=1 FL=1
MRLRDELTSDFAGLLLDTLDGNGLKTCVSDDASINRKRMNRRGIGQLRVHQLLRLLVALCHHCSRHSEKLFLGVWWKLGLMIVAMADSEQYFDFVDDVTQKSRNQRSTAEGKVKPLKL